MIQAGGPMLSRVIIYQYLLIAPHALLLVALAAMIRRRLYREFPIFFAYLIEEILQAAIMITVLEIPSVPLKSYNIAYVTMWAISTAFRFGVIYEIFVHVFRDYAAIGEFGKPLFRGAMVLFLFIAFALTAYSGLSSPQVLMVQNVLDRGTSVLQCGLLVTLFLFTSRLALSWRSYAFGITLGMGLKASADLAATAIRSQTGLSHQMPLNYFVMGAFHLCVLIWIVYLFAPERSYAPQRLPQHDLEDWNAELERLLKQP